jgi:hypothetical protein
MMATRQRRPSQSASVTAPIGGLNARDSLAAMPPQDAVILNNFFCSPTTVDLRRGYIQWATGLPNWVESLLPYTSATSQKLFAASGTAIYDATANAAVGAAVVSGLANARFQHCNFGTAGGQFLLNVNGADKLRGYDGTSWWADGDGTHDITGFNTSLAVHINSFKNRVYLVEKDSFSVWYLPLSSISGAAQELDLSSLFRLGGYLMAMATWTIDNAAGIQEYAVFLSSQGEIALYQGYDPSTAGSWSLVGMFRVGRPIGRRCFTKIGSDVVVVSADGAFPLSKALLTDRYQLQDALSNKIVNLMNEAVQSYSANFGWQPCLYPLGSKLLINVPVQENSQQIQFVMNTINGAWQTFSDWNAACFEVLQDTLFFGGNGVVCKADYGNEDNGGNITGTAKTAFQYFGAPGQLKRWTMMRPIFNTAASLSPAIRLDIDFEDITPTQTATYSGLLGTPWDTALWDTFPWQTAATIQKSWQGANGVGYCAAFHMVVTCGPTSLQWMAIDYVYEKGAIL